MTCARYLTFSSRKNQGLLGKLGTVENLQNFFEFCNIVLQAKTFVQKCIVEKTTHKNAPYYVRIACKTAHEGVMWTKIQQGQIFWGFSHPQIHKLMEQCGDLNLRLGKKIKMRETKIGRFILRSLRGKQVHDALNDRDVFGWEPFLLFCGALVGWWNREMWQSTAAHMKDQSLGENVYLATLQTRYLTVVWMETIAIYMSVYMIGK